MNMVRRKRISDVMKRLSIIMDEVDTILAEEQDYLDNMPENLQDSLRCEIAENAVSNLEDAIDSLTDVVDYLESSID